jgi:hypothetical protein
MESPGQQATRLLDALDELIGQEGMYLRGGYYDLVVGIRQRTEPIVQQLTALAGQPGVADDCRPRVAALLRLSAEHDAILQGKIEELGAEIRRTDQARYRATQMAPAYAGAHTASLPRFQAAG